MRAYYIKDINRFQQKKCYLKIEDQKEKTKSERNCFQFFKEFFTEHSQPDSMLVFIKSSIIRLILHIESLHDSR